MVWSTQLVPRYAWRMTCLEALRMHVQLAAVYLAHGEATRALALYDEALELFLDRAHVRGQVSCHSGMSKARHLLSDDWMSHLHAEVSFSLSLHLSVYLLTYLSLYVYARWMLDTSPRAWCIQATRYKPCSIQATPIRYYTHPILHPSASARVPYCTHAMVQWCTHPILHLCHSDTAPVS